MTIYMTDRRPWGIAKPKRPKGPGAPIWRPRRGGWTPGPLPVDVRERLGLIRRRERLQHREQIQGLDGWGGWKKAGRWIKKHKKALIIGAAVATGVGLVGTAAIKAGAAKALAAVKGMGASGALTAAKGASSLIPRGAGGEPEQAVSIPGADAGAAVLAQPMAPMVQVQAPENPGVVADLMNYGKEAVRGVGSFVGDTAKAMAKARIAQMTGQATADIADRFQPEGGAFGADGRGPMDGPWVMNPDGQQVTGPDGAPILRTGWELGPDGLPRRKPKDGMPAWALPAGIAAAGLLLVLAMKK